MKRLRWVRSPSGFSKKAELSGFELFVSDSCGAWRWTVYVAGANGRRVGSDLCGTEEEAKNAAIRVVNAELAAEVRVTAQGLRGETMKGGTLTDEEVVTLARHLVQDEIWRLGRDRARVMADLVAHNYLPDSPMVAHAERMMGARLAYADLVHLHEALNDELESRLKEAGGAK